MLAFAVLLRFFSYFISVIDHDESTYIVIADALLKGQTYFIDVIDTKPIGIFWIYAAIQAILGPSIFGMRLAASLFLGLTAFFLYQAKKKDDSSHQAALAAGLLFIILNSMFTFYGISPNTETFFTTFTAAALYLFIHQKNILLYFGVGLLLGVGFIIKYVVAFDALALGLLLAWQTYIQKHNTVTFLVKGFLMILGFTLPFAALLLYYQSLGFLTEFLFYSFEVSSRYPDSASLWEYPVFFFDFMGRFFPVSAFFFLAFFNKHIPQSTRVLGMLWFVLAWIIALIPGKFFAHYCIQVMLPFCFLAGSFFDLPISQTPKWIRWVRTGKFRWYLFGILIAAVLFFHIQDYFLKKDYPQIIAAELEKDLKENEQIYIGNYQQILYHLLKKGSPIPYVHSSLVWTPSHIYALKIDLEQLAAQLIKEAPRFIILKGGNENDTFPIKNFIQTHYQVKQIFRDEIFLYECKK